MIRGTRVMGICMILSGCVAPLPESRMNLVEAMAPESWSASKEGVGGVDGAWVSKFGDSTLTALVREAVVKNPEMKALAERVYQAEKAAYVAGSSRRLFLDSNLTGNRDKIQFVGFPFGGSQTTTRLGSGLNTSWELDLWGRVKAGESAARADAMAAQLDQKAGEASLAGQVCKAYFALVESRQQVALAKRAFSIRKETAELVAERYAQSLTEEGGSASQLRLAQTDVASSTAIVAQRNGEVEVARRQLELLVGRYPSGSLDSASVFDQLPKKPPTGLPSDLLQRRPDILAAERRFISSGHSVREAKLAPFPSLSLTGSVGTATDALQSILSSSQGIWSLGAEVGQDILAGGAVQGELKIRESRDRENLAILQDTVLKAFGEVEIALNQGHWLRRQIVELRKAERLAKEAATAAGEDFDSGTIDALTLLTTRSRAIEIEEQVLNLQRLQLENRVDLHLALGGKFQTKGK